MQLFNMGKYLPHNTIIHLHLFKNEKNEYNEYEDLWDGDVDCNFQSRSQKLIDGNTLVTNNTTTVLIFKNILPERDALNSGYIEYGEEKRTIISGKKVRDLYGNFQFIQFECE